MMKKLILLFLILPSIVMAASVGNTDTSGTHYWSDFNERFYGSVLTMTEAGILDSLSILIDPNSSGYLQIALYKESDLSFVDSFTIAVTAGAVAWFKVHAYLGASLTAVNYAVVGWTNAWGVANVMEIDENGTHGNEWVDLTPATPWPTTMTTFNTDATLYLPVRIVYHTGGAPPASSPINNYIQSKGMGAVQSKSGGSYIQSK
jgi:hypothetical protein